MPRRFGTMHVSAVVLASLTGLMGLPGAHADSLQQAGSSVDKCATAPRSTPTPDIDWRNKRVLWLGTSIPQQGIRSRDSYPELFCQIMGCAVTNNSLAGSHMKWSDDYGDESCKAKRNAPKGLSATTRELRAKQIAALPDDGQDSYDASCNPAVNPLRTGYEHRINEAWKQNAFDIVVIDHGHNDRPITANGLANSFGTLVPAPFEITQVIKGRQTELLVANAPRLNEFDDIAIRTPGIRKMDYWTGEILAVKGNHLLIDLDSRSVDGELSGPGSATKLDKAKLFDAYNLIISDIFHMGAIYNSRNPQIILVTPPTEWTGGKNDGSIARINKALCELAEEWKLPYLNLNDLLAIDKDSLYNHLEDGKHPLTHASRLQIAEAIASWARQKR